MLLKPASYRFDLDPLFARVITLYNVCAVPWGVFSTMGDIMSTVGDILSTVGGYLEYRGDIMINVGVFSTVGIS